MYLDLFSGKGEYDNGELSTALRIVNFACEDSILCKRMICILNDRTKKFCDSIEETLLKLKCRDKLANQPVVTNFEVDELTTDIIAKIRGIPTFCFIDPYGFKGPSIKLVQSVIKDWGCECMVFFNTSDINRNLELGQSREHLELFFGADRFSRLLKDISLTPHKRMELALSSYRESCFEAGAGYFLPFRIDCSRGKTFHLIYLTKHPLGFKKMKEVMAKYSKFENGFPAYVYKESFENAGEQQSFDFGQKMSMSWLKNLLLEIFKGQSISVKTIVEKCDKLGYLFLHNNVRDALDQLANEGLIRDITSSKRLRPVDTFGDKRIVQFPSR